MALLGGMLAEREAIRMARSCVVSATSEIDSVTGLYVLLGSVEDHTSPFGLRLALYAEESLRHGVPFFTLAKARTEHHARDAIWCC